MDLQIDETIEIERVANGWVVRPGYNLSRGNMVKSSSVLVFQTIGALVKFVADHFPNSNDA